MTMPGGAAAPRISCSSSSIRSPCIGGDGADPPAGSKVDVDLFAYQRVRGDRRDGAPLIGEELLGHLLADDALGRVRDKDGVAADTALGLIVRHVDTTAAMDSSFHWMYLLLEFDFPLERHCIAKQARPSPAPPRGIAEISAIKRIAEMQAKINS